MRSCALALLLCFACARGAVRRDRLPTGESVDVERVLDEARRHLGRSTVRVDGHSYRADCSGFVEGIFSAGGVNLMLGDSGEDGVRLIFRYVEQHGENHYRAPLRGDVVYFDNTWDRNRNGKLDDPFTHVGIVEEVRSDGTVLIIHHTNHGIVREPMNLAHPHDLKDDAGHPINAWLRSKRRGDPTGTPHLMSELFSGFGTVR